ncbi:hypothetical protein GN956_G13626 [Arapaima gigas]
MPISAGRIQWAGVWVVLRVPIFTHPHRFHLRNMKKKKIGPGCIRNLMASDVRCQWRNPGSVCVDRSAVLLKFTHPETLLPAAGLRDFALQENYFFTAAVESLYQFQKKFTS